jgi:hypothetical protein
MKKSFLIGITFIWILASCHNRISNPTDNLFIADNGIEYKYSDFELYDSSTHVLYLKKPHPKFKFDETFNFSLLANGETIYKGLFWSGFSSVLPSGPYIPFFPYDPDFIIRIGHMTIDNKPIDQRNDPRIISALNEHNLLHSGLSLTINSIDISATQLTFKFTVTNVDMSNLLILDLDKTGPNLFHYYSNGLSIRTATYGLVFSSTITPQAPSHSDSLSTIWLSELKSGASRQFTINYPIDSSINPGNYSASFQFPGVTQGLT